MTLLKMAFDAVYKIMNIPIDILGYQASFMEIIIYIILGSLVVYFIVNLSE